jgi:uncharacterized membrane protein YcaP (DUF421 family)
MMEKYVALNWEVVFVPSGSIVEVMLRGTLMYFALVLLMRLVLRREPGSIGLADMLLVVILADASQNAMAGGYKSWTEGVVLVGTLLFWNYAFDWLAYHLGATGIPRQARQITQPEMRATPGL